MSERIFGVILFARPGRMPAGLRVLLKSLFPLVQIEQTEALSTVRGLLAVEQPCLVLVDAALPEEQAWLLVEEIKHGFTRHHCVILAHSSIQQQQAQSAGAQAVLLDGFTADDLLTAVNLCL
jgi:DNA-binding NarL/FixJ family response regulator